MREDKRKRLEARGWRVGTATEFLGTSPEEDAYIDIKLRMADGLRRLRDERHLTQAEVAKLLKSSQSRVAKMESGDGSVSLDLMVRSLFALGASRAELVRIIKGKRTAKAA